MRTSVYTDIGRDRRQHVLYNEIARNNTRLQSYRFIQVLCLASHTFYTFAQFLFTDIYKNLEMSKLCFYESWSCSWAVKLPKLWECKNVREIGEPIVREYAPCKLKSMWLQWCSQEREPGLIRSKASVWRGRGTCGGPRGVCQSQRRSPRGKLAARPVQVTAKRSKCIK